VFASRSLALLTLTSALSYAATPPRTADACGPDLPVELLADRDDTIATLHEGYFLDEIARVEAASRAYDVVIGSGDPDLRPGMLVERIFYDAAADAFHEGDYALARERFERFLALPAALRRERTTWAVFTLARMADGDDAIARYREVRTLVDAGFRDHLGLAAASLGQEARIHYDRARPAGTVRALTLYAQQASLAGSDGDISTLFIVRDLLTGERAHQLDEALRYPIGQQIFSIYLATRGDELDEATADDLFRRLVAAAALRDTMPGADHLAVAAYRRAQWDVAATIAAKLPDAPRSQWVRAKLALRAGNTAEGEALLAAAAFGLAGDHDASNRLAGERAVLALAANRPLDAMDLAWRMRDEHPDAVYIAERVLTIAELTTFVERVAPAATAPPDPHEGWGQVNPWLLRDILGRRLMRAGRFAAAWRYLSHDHLLAAWTYATALARADAAGDPIDRAAALHDASLIARRDGLEILGTTHAPDWGLYTGAYDPYAWLAWSDEPRPPRSRWFTASEEARVAASAPPHPQRFHYRFTASQLAEQSADLLPHQSQAFAVTLCRAAAHIRFRDEDRLHALYARYLDEGPMYSMDFGFDCPAPEFERARRFVPPPPEPSWPPAMVAIMCLVGLLVLLRRIRPGRYVEKP
jgi:hypothetical protein